jgi:putative ABC transport system permease protein
VSGDAQKALGDPLSVVISAGAAGKLFPHEDAVGKTIQFEWWGEWVDVNVAGVIRDIPRNSHLQYAAAKARFAGHAAGENCRDNGSAQSRQ